MLETRLCEPKVRADEAARSRVSTTTGGDFARGVGEFERVPMIEIGGVTAVVGVQRQQCLSACVR